MNNINKSHSHPKTCSAVNCKNNSTEYNLFSVPTRTVKSNEEQIRRRNKYLQQINRKDIFEQEAKGKYKEYRLCDKHFEERCFKTNKNGKKYLITSDDVYPTLYMGYNSLTKNLCDERLIQKKKEREVRAAKRIKLTEEIELKERKRMEYESNDNNNISDFNELKEKVFSFNDSDSEKEEQYDDGSPLAGGLTLDTFYSTIHTLKAAASMVRYMLSQLKYPMVLLGMFSNDPIENRFGDYRQHCGGETNIESLQVLQCELKKFLSNLYKKCTNSDGSINREQLAQHFIKFDSYQDEEQKNAKKQLSTLINNYFKSSPSVHNNINNNRYSELESYLGKDFNMKKIVYMAGYLVKKLKPCFEKKPLCQNCSYIYFKSETDTPSEDESFLNS
eukprot:Pgem_evm1s19035